MVNRSSSCDQALRNGRSNSWASPRNSGAPNSNGQQTAEEGHCLIAFASFSLPVHIAGQREG